jgi:hypothetical protein
MKDERFGCGKEKAHGQVRLNGSFAASPPPLQALRALRIWPDAQPFGKRMLTKR